MPSPIIWPRMAEVMWKLSWMRNVKWIVFLCCRSNVVLLLVVGGIDAYHLSILLVFFSSSVIIATLAVRASMLQCLIMSHFPLCRDNFMNYERFKRARIRECREPKTSCQVNRLPIRCVRVDKSEIMRTMSGGFEPHSLQWFGNCLLYAAWDMLPVARWAMRQHTGTLLFSRTRSRCLKWCDVCRPHFLFSPCTLFTFCMLVSL